MYVILVTGAKGASVPSLGLSNKAVFTSNNIAEVTPKSDKEYYPEESYFTAVDMCGKFISITNT